MSEPSGSAGRPRRRGRARAGRRGPRLATPRGVPPGAAARADGRFDVLQFPNGSANLTYLVQLRRHAARRAPAAVRPAGARRPRHAAGVTAVDAPVEALRPGAAGLPVLRRPRRHRLGLPRRRVPQRRRRLGPRAGVDEPSRRRRRGASGSRSSTHSPTSTSSIPTRSGWASSAGPTGSSSGRSPVGASVGSSSTPVGCRRCPASAAPARRDDAAPFQPACRCCTTTTRSTTASSSRPTPIGSRRSSTGTWPRSASRWSISGTLLNYWPDPADFDGDRPLHVAGLEHIGLPTRAEVVERYAARTGLDVSRGGLVRGVRHVEDVRRARAALPTVRPR